MLLFSSAALSAPLDARARAQLLMQRGQYAEAATLLAPLAATHPRDADLQYRLGAAQAQAGNNAAAINAYNRAAQLRPGEALYAGALARLYADMQRADRASFWYRKLLRLRPKNSKLASEAAAFLLQQNKPLEAELILKQATAANPKDADLWLQLAECYAKMKLGAEQAKCLERAVRLKPVQPEELAKLIDLYLRSGDPARALPYLQMARARRPHDASLQARIAECHLAANDPKSAATAYRAAVGLAPRVAAYRLVLAQLLAESDPRSALAEYSTAFALQQATADQLLTAAAVASKAGRTDLACQYLGWLVALKPQEAEPRQLLIQAALTGQDIATAAMQWRELRLAGQQQFALDEAELALRLGGREWALGRLQEVADRSARDPALLARLASLFQQLHDAPRAEMLARAALGLSIGSGSDEVRATRLLAAQVLLQVGEPEAAEGVFRAVLQAVPGHPAARRGVALCALQRGQVRAAWEQLRDATRQHPHDVETMQALLQAGDAADNLDDTAHFLKELIRQDPQNSVVLDGLTQLYHTLGGAALAARGLADLAEWEPRKGLISLAAARELTAAGRRTDAATIYERLARGSEFMMAARAGLCHVLLAQQRYAELLAALTRLTGPQAIGAEPYRLLLTVRGDLALQGGEGRSLAPTAMAAAAVVTARPESQEYYLGLADLYMATRESDAGVKFLQAEATRRDVAQPATLGLARLLRRLDRAKEALVWLDQAGAATSPAGMLERAQCLLQTKQVTQAGLVAQQLLDLPATATAGLELAEAHMVAAEAYAVGYRPEEALWHLVQAVKTGGPRERLNYRLVGLCLNQPLPEAAVLNALQQLYASGFTDMALGVADALVTKPGFKRVRSWAMARAARGT